MKHSFIPSSLSSESGDMCAHAALSRHLVSGCCRNNNSSGCWWPGASHRVIQGKETYAMAFSPLLFQVRASNVKIRTICEATCLWLKGHGTYFFIQAISARNGFGLACVTYISRLFSLPICHDRQGRVSHQKAHLLLRLLRRLASQGIV